VSAASPLPVHKSRCRQDTGSPAAREARWDASCAARKPTLPYIVPLSPPPQFHSVRQLRKSIRSTPPHRILLEAATSRGMTPTMKMRCCMLRWTEAFLPLDLCTRQALRCRRSMRLRQPSSEGHSSSQEARSTPTVC
jgi:hypothetical protein